jgi:hypothetical protein
MVSKEGTANNVCVIYIMHLLSSATHCVCVMPLPPAAFNCLMLAVQLKQPLSHSWNCNCLMHCQVVDPDNFKGPIRLRLAAGAAPEAASAAAAAVTDDAVGASTADKRGSGRTVRTKTSTKPRAAGGSGNGTSSLSNVGGSSAAAAEPGSQPHAALQVAAAVQKPAAAAAAAGSSAMEQEEEVAKTAVA